MNTWKTKVEMVSFAIAIEENGRYFAYPLTVPANNNLASEFNGIKGLKSANYCASRKKATELTDFWNQCYRNNGTYLYQSSLDKKEDKE